jgi:hypothetical protein
MTGDVKAQFTFPTVTPRQSDTWVKSYRYLRLTMVGLLLALAAAVVYQTYRQGFFLASVSAYYYSPAQAVFVGALIGTGACMIALEGTNVVEEVFLNLGGIFAAVVAIVPTSRGDDYETAIRACKEAADPLLTGGTSTDPNCPTVLELADATRANVTNNVIALLVVGALGLLASLYFAMRDAKRTPTNKGRPPKSFWSGFVITAIVWVLGLVASLASIEWLIDNAHYIAAGGLFVCILAFAAANAVRHDRAQPGGNEAREEAGSALGAARDTLLRNPMEIIRNPRGIDRYTWLAWSILGAAAVGIVLMLTTVITLFLLEIIVAFSFIAFWLVQTIEQLP